MDNTIDAMETLFGGVSIFLTVLVKAGKKEEVILLVASCYPCRDFAVDEYIATVHC